MSLLHFWGYRIDSWGTISCMTMKSHPHVFLLATRLYNTHGFDLHLFKEALFPLFDYVLRYVRDILGAWPCLWVWPRLAFGVEGIRGRKLFRDRVRFLMNLGKLLLHSEYLTIRNGRSIILTPIRYTSPSEATSMSLLVRLFRPFIAHTYLLCILRLLRG